MANIRVRAASLYLNGTKVAEIEGTSYDIMSGDESQIGDPGYIGHSEGAIITTVQATGVIPTSGMSVSILDALLKKKNVNVSLALIDGKIHQITMRPTKASVKSAHKNGTMNGDFSFEGGEPVVA